MTLLAILPVAIAVQLVSIYVSDGKDLREQGMRQASSQITIPAGRGTILDRSGRTLAVNTARYEVAVDPTRAGYDEKSDALYSALSRATGRPTATYRQMVQQRTSRQYVLLERSVNEAGKEILEELRLPGLILTPRFARRYTYGRTASHVLGHVDADLNGLAGIELIYDQYLRGTDGRQAVQRDRRGIIRPAVDGRFIPPVSGQEIRLTLDLVLQSILQEELVQGVNESAARWGTAIAMDPRTGAILAMANAPDYDPNRPGAFPEAARRNHAITDQIEPGSTFKLVTAIAALESGVVTPADTIDTGQGWAVFGGHTMRDTRAYGRLSFPDAISVSSNVAFARVGTQVEPGRFYQYIRNMGFGQHTLIDLPGEESGVLHRPDTWSRSSQSSMSIGYSITVTPLQLVTAYAALANGGLLVRPHVVAERRDMASGRLLWTAPVDSVRRAFLPATADTLRPIFERVVSTDGTARRAMVDGLTIAGKTGTARIAEGGRYVSAYRGSFVGMFPADNPEIVILIVIDRPTRGYYGGTVAAPIFGRIAERWAAVQPTLSGTHIAELPAEPASTLIPDVTGVPHHIALTTLRSTGLNPASPRRMNEWGPIADLRPTPGDTVRVGTSVRLTADNSASTISEIMPDVTGLSARNAAAWLSHLGVVPRVTCTGAVVRQTPAAGEPLTATATLSCS